jgi:hypothetical protein
MLIILRNDMFVNVRAALLPQRKMIPIADADASIVYKAWAKMIKEAQGTRHCKRIDATIGFCLRT